MNKKKQVIFSLFLLTGISLFLTLNMHSKTNLFTYKSEIWSDKAGYYVYLPAFFLYDFDGSLFPSGIEKKTGYGFDLSSNKIITKYTCGVAILQAPFFLTAHVLAKALGEEANGFSLFYYRAIDVAAVCYTMGALCLLYFFLQRYLKNIFAIYATLFCLFFTTNLYFYAISETGMSHVYSLFLFAAFLVLSTYVFKPSTSLTHLFLFGTVAGMIVLVRPLNILFFPVFFFIQPQETPLHILQRIIRTPLFFILFPITIAFAICIPQLLYWKYLSGKYIYYAYTKEGFIYLSNPKLQYMWFSTYNGFFIYTPLFLFALIGMYWMRKNLPLLGNFLVVYFLLISYVFASWWSWNYGCSYGCRAYIEYYALFCLPLGIFLEKTFQMKSLLKYLSLTLIFLFTVINLKIIYGYEGCWYGGLWDWQEYIKLLFKSV